jgi:hypothetical protein
LGAGIAGGIGAYPWGVSLGGYDGKVGFSALATEATGATGASGSVNGDISEAEVEWLEILALRNGLLRTSGSDLTLETFSLFTGGSRDPSRDSSGFDSITSRRFFKIVFF